MEDYVAGAERAYETYYAACDCRARAADAAEEEYMNQCVQREKNTAVLAEKIVAAQRAAVVAAAAEAERAAAVAAAAERRATVLAQMAALQAELDASAPAPEVAALPEVHEVAALPEVHEVAAPEPLQKKKNHRWNPWAREMGFKTGNCFYVSYKGQDTELTGLWENEKYYLCGPPDVIPKRPDGCSDEEAAKHGWGVPIKWDAPNHVAALVKMAFGAPITMKNHGAGAGPRDVKYIVGGVRTSVY